VADEQDRRGVLGKPTRDHQQVGGIGRVHRVVVADRATQHVDQRFGGRFGARGWRTHHKVDLPACDVSGDHRSCPFPSSAERRAKSSNEASDLSDFV
jgi:hypothetical protein